MLMILWAINRTYIFRLIDAHDLWGDLVTLRNLSECLGKPDVKRSFGVLVMQS